MIYTYLIQALDGGPVKIGSSRDPKKRLGHLQVGNPDELAIMLLTDIDEKKLQARYSHLHIRGEWYLPCKTMWKLPQVFTPLYECCWWVPNDDYITDFAHHHVIVSDNRSMKEVVRLRESKRRRRIIDRAYDA